jgi:hypothetical protein
MITPLNTPTYQDRDNLIRISEMPEPRHLFVLPAWLDSVSLDRLLELEYLTYAHCQRDPSGLIQVMMNLQITAKGRRMIAPAENWRHLALKGSLAGASLTLMSVLILYLG